MIDLSPAHHIDPKNPPTAGQLYSIRQLSTDFLSCLLRIRPPFPAVVVTLQSLDAVHSPYLASIHDNMWLMPWNNTKQSRQRSPMQAYFLDGVGSFCERINKLNGFAPIQKLFGVQDLNLRV